MTEHTPTKVIVTGAYGLIGNLVYGHMAAQPERYDVYAMVRRIKPSVRIQNMALTDIPLEKVRLADLTDFEAVQRAMQGMDVVVHMAADPDGRSGWESVLNNNIIGGHNMFEASRLAGVKRIVYASTNQVVFGYMTPEKRAAMFGRSAAELDLNEFPLADHTKPTRPMNDYACSKVYGEALAHMYAYAHDMSCIVLRIGWVLDSDTLPSPKAAPIWCSHRDIIQIVERCVDAPPELRFDVFFGHSDNKPNLVDIQHAKEVLGYAPQDGQQIGD